MADYGEYISLLSTDHILYIIGLIGTSLLLFKNKETVIKNRRVLTWIILIVSVCQQILLYSTYYRMMGFDLGESLPLHISRVNTLLGIIYLLTKNETVFRILSYFGLYAWTSFIYPSRVYSIIHPIGLSFFVNHVITLLLPFYGMIAYSERIKIGYKKRVYPLFVIYLACVYFINLLVDGNYFYFKHKPIVPAASDPLYIFLVLIFTYVLFSLGERIYMKFQKDFL